MPALRIDDLRPLQSSGLADGRTVLDRTVQQFRRHLERVSDIRSSQRRIQLLDIDADESRGTRLLSAQ